MNPKFSRALSRTHNAEVGDRPEPKKFFGTVGATIAGFIAAIVLAVAAAGGSYAYLSQSAEVMPATTITSGTASLAVTSPLALPTDTMYPGMVLRGVATVKNTGDVPLALRAVGLTSPSASTAFSQALVVRVTDCTNGTGLPVWTGTFASAATSDLGSTLAVGSSAILCVSVSLPTTAPADSQGQAALDFSLSIDGTQASS